MRHYRGLVAVPSRSGRDNDLLFGDSALSAGRRPLKVGSGHDQKARASKINARSPSPQGRVGTCEKSHTTMREYGLRRPLKVGSGLMSVTTLRHRQEHRRPLKVGSGRRKTCGWLKFTICRRPLKVGSEQEVF